MLKQPIDRTEKLDYAERWIRDGLRAVDPPGALLTVEVDMTNAAALRERLKIQGTPVTYTHLLVHAAAAALKAHPELHRLLAGNKRLFPATVDICLSIAGDAVVTPVLIIKAAETRSLTEIAAEVREGSVQARSEDEKRMRIVRQWGWIIPFGFMRRALIRRLLNTLSYRRTASGTFQITTVSSVDMIVPFLFNTAAALGAGQVRERVVAHSGRIEIRPTLILACCCDHKAWNGMEAAKFLNAVKTLLEAA